MLITNNNKIDYDLILQIVRGQLIEVMQSYPTIYEKYNVKIANEQYFVKPEQEDPNSIYLVMRFGPASVSWSQTVMSFSIMVLSEENSIDVSKNLLTEFALRYNLTKWEDDGIQEVIGTPSVSNNFNIAYAGYRSVMSVDGAFLIAPQANSYKFIYIYTDKDDNGVETEKEEEIKCLSQGFNANFQLDTQVMYNKNDIASSIGKWGTISLSLSSYLLLDSIFMTDLLKCATMKHEDRLENGINTSFKIKIVFRDGNSLTEDFKLVSFQSGQPLGQIPTVNIGLTM